MNLPDTASELLRDLAAAPDTPEPVEREYTADVLGFDYPAGDVADFDPLYADTSDPDAEARAQQERDTLRLQAAREAHIRRIVRDELLLRRLMAEQPWARPPLRECAARPFGSVDYRGWKPG